MMASIKEVGDAPKDNRPNRPDGAEVVSANTLSGTADIGQRVEEYLTSVERELVSNRNPRLSVERNRLLNLLESYKRLCEVYERQRTPAQNSRRKDALGIRSILYPDLYEDQREVAKDRLRKSLVKSRSYGDRCVPRNYRPENRAAEAVVDTRQREKDRFVRLVSSAPSVLHQAPAVRRRLPSSARPALVRREEEKERLARILSSDLDGHLRRRPVASTSSQVKKTPPRTSNLHSKTSTTNKRDFAKTQGKPHFPVDFTNKSGGGGMVRRDVARRSGVSQVDRRNRLLSLTNKEHLDNLNSLQGRGNSKKDKAVLAREASILDLSSDREKQDMVHRSLRHSASAVSVSTQTEDVLASAPPAPTYSPQLSPESIESSPAEEASKLFPVQKEPFITSPRAKLIKDLHGVSPCLPGASPLLTLPEQGACEEKQKRCAYAEALRAQIDEKRRLEEEKRKKELEEDEHVERRAREQQHRLKQEWEREQTLRQDWLMQKEAQEETVRQRMVELELEAKELKRKERLRRGGERPTSPLATSPRQPLSPREVEQLLPQAMRDSMMSSLIMDKPRPKTLPLENNNNTTLANQNTDNVSSEAECLAVTSPSAVQHEGDEETNLASDQDRPLSPVLPAVQTDSILRRSVYSSPRLELVQGEKEKEELLRGDRILTQLGVFRRELELEQERLEQRLFEQGSSS